MGWADFGGHSAPLTRIDRAAFNPYHSIARTAPLGCASRARNETKHVNAAAVRSKVKQDNATTWLVSTLVSEVKFTEWTSEGEMRHPVFLGLRTDKKANDVIREQA